MSAFTFVVNVTISLSIDVEAKTLAAAMEEARGAGVKSLCHQCAGHEAGVWCTSGELDCDPNSSELVDLFIDDREISTPSEFRRASRKWRGVDK